MATRSWVGSSYLIAGSYPDWNLSTNWDLTGTIGVNDRGQFDINAGATPIVFAVGVATSTGAASIAANYAPAYIQFDSGSYQVTWANGAGGDTFSVADGKTMYINISGQNGCLFTNYPSAYVGTNAVLTLRRFNGTTALGPFNKKGPGIMYFGYRRAFANSGSAGNGSTSNFNGGIVIQGGDIAIRSSDTLPYATGQITPFGTGSITFSNAGSRIVLVDDGYSAAVQTCSNNLQMNANGTVRIEGSGTGLIFGTAGGGSTLTVESTANGYAQFSGVSCPVNVTGNMTMASNAGISSAITGSGTITMNNGSLSASSPAFTGTINGNFTVDGGVLTIGGVITGTVTLNSGILTFPNVNSGVLGNIGYVTAVVTGRFNGTGTGTNLNGGNSVQPATLIISGPTAGIAAGRTVAMLNGSAIQLAGGCTLEAALAANTDTTNVSLSVTDATSCTYSGALSTNQASGRVTVQAAANGALTLSGSISGGSAGRTIALNEDAGYTGTIRVTGAGITGASPVTLKRGTFHINSTTTVSITSSMNVTGTGTKVACQATAGIPARVQGNLTFGTGTSFKFGAP